MKLIDLLSITSETTVKINTASGNQTIVWVGVEYFEKELMPFSTVLTEEFLSSEIVYASVKDNMLFVELYPPGSYEFDHKDN